MMITRVGEYSSRLYKEKRLHFCSLVDYSALSPIVFLILGASPSSIYMEESLHCQFPLAVPGVLILAYFPSPSQSWIGTTIRKDLDFSPSWMILSLISSRLMSPNLSFRGAIISGGISLSQPMRVVLS